MSAECPEKGTLQQPLYVLVSLPADSITIQIKSWLAVSGLRMSRLIKIAPPQRIRKGLDVL